MKMLIVYATKYGCTAKAAKKLADSMEGNVTLVDIKKDNNINLNKYDMVAIGGSIYAGNIQKEIKEFCSEHLDQLMQKELGLFICCGMTEKAEEQLKLAFPDQLLEKAKVKMDFGYEYNFDKMSFMSRIVVKALAKVKESKSEINDNNIKIFAGNLAG